MSIEANSPCFQIVGDSGELHPPSLKKGLKCLEIITPYETFAVSLEELNSLTHSPYFKRITMGINCVSSGKILGKNGQLTFGGLSFEWIYKQIQKRELFKSIGFYSIAPGSIGPKEEPHHTFLEIEYPLTSPYFLLAWEVNNKPLLYPNGGPLRTIVGPDRYFYKSIKWLSRIEFLEDPISELKGTWEKYGGYHPLGRVEKKERFLPFMAIKEQKGKELCRRELSLKEGIHLFWELYEKKNLSGLVVSQLHHVLEMPKDFKEVDFGKEEEAAEIRGTLFKKTNFQDARMEGTNFSLSRFSACHFSSASQKSLILKDVDLEGAYLVGSHLEKVTFEGANLWNCHFYGSKYGPAKVKGMTLLNCRGLDPKQEEWLQKDGAIILRE